MRALTSPPPAALRADRLFWGAWIGLSLGALGLRALAPAAAPPRAPVEAAASDARVVALPPKPEGAGGDPAGTGPNAQVYTEADCRRRQGELRRLCFKQLARQRAADDLQGAAAACREAPPGEGRDECLSDVAELHARTDEAAALGLCPQIEAGKWADQCVFGVALARVSLDPAGAFRRCDGAGRFRDFCRHDVNGEIAVVDVDLALQHCAAEEGDLLTRKSCWHGIGKYIARVDVDRAWAACDRVPPGPERLYRENCVHGLAWGAAERQGAAFRAQCDRAATERDSCLLGVAYNLKRFDKAQAEGLCRSAARADLQARCLEFVGG